MANYTEGAACFNVGCSGGEWEEEKGVAAIFPLGARELCFPRLVDGNEDELPERCGDMRSLAHAWLCFDPSNLNQIRHTVQICGPFTRRTKNLLVLL